jgi:Dyp-type peroxidase family
MIRPKPVLEAPALGALHQEESPEPRHPEPPLAARQIQGNIFPGFLKDHQCLLFLKIADPAAFAGWLERLVPFIATMDEVLAFSRLFKAMRFRRKTECQTVKATWINIAFSFAGLRQLNKLRGDIDLDFKDQAFTSGLLKRSRQGLLGDPRDAKMRGAPHNWVIGGPGREADLVLIIASDEQADLFSEVERIERSIYAFTDQDGEALPSGVEIIFKQAGATLPGTLTGHEHFGFRDGISQPGIRGRLRDGSFLTPRQNPRNDDQGKPGQDLLWPGEFVFGYPGQDADRDVPEPGEDPLENPKRAAPPWAKNGSFLVFRRLRQDVGLFHRFLNATAKRLGVSPDLLGARLVGRWTSGAPTVIAANDDDFKLADDDCRNNNFEFDADEPDDSKPTTHPQTAQDCHHVPEETPNDPQGLHCPFAGHIRKAYPRNDRSKSVRQLGEKSTQTHRLLRRGIPFGEVSASTFSAPAEDTVDRGLLFLAYQVSIVDQFEFVTQNWVNNADFKVKGAGFDPIIGQNDQPKDKRKRAFAVNLPKGRQTITSHEEWVIPTGGGYFFAPSIDALTHLAKGFPARAKK